MTREEVSKVYEISGSYSKAASVLGISRARVHQIVSGKRYKRKGTLQGRDWAREKVRVRDNFTCQSCRKVWRVGEVRFDVHHINDKNGENTRSFDRKESYEGLITLCHKCHLKIERNNGKWNDT